MPYAAPVNFFKRINYGQDENNWYCPRGHPIHFTKTDVDKLNDRLEQEKRRRQNAEASAERERNNAEYERNCARAQKAAKTRLKNRISKGVCPCCNRTFQNLMAHMNHKHPEFGSKLPPRQYREAKGLNQADLAKKIGVKAPYVSMYERNKPLPAEAKQRLDDFYNDCL